MNILKDIKNTIRSLGIPQQTGSYSKTAPSKYIVVTPLYDEYELYIDNTPSIDVQSARITLFSKESYIEAKNDIINVLMESDFTITSRMYNGYDSEAGYYQYTIDVAKHYEMEGQ